jgi:hypothetical protein
LTLLFIYVIIKASKERTRIKMTVKELINKLKKLDKDLDVAVAFNDEDGTDFHLEVSDYCVFLVADEWGATIQEDKEIE